RAARSIFSSSLRLPLVSSDIAYPNQFNRLISPRAAGGCHKQLAYLGAKGLSLWAIGQLLHAMRHAARWQRSTCRSGRRNGCGFSWSFAKMSHSRNVTLALLAESA